MNKNYGQAARPTGFIGRLLGQIMGWHNRPDNEWTLELLGISASEDILEIGYGPGKAIQKAHALYPKCQIVGIDHSEEMLAAASRLNREAIAAGTVDLRIGDVEILNFADGTFDKAFPTPKLSVMHYRTSWKIIPNERNTYPEC
jgi:ubiquinone/menaquinone biosynthesis C-methylase UbiE